MPKSINREYDKSKSVLTLSANFAVFVPGFANDSIKEGDKWISWRSKKRRYLF